MKNANIEIPLFIDLTDVFGDKIIINISRVQCVEKHEDSDNSVISMIGSDKYYYVQETVEEIIKEISKVWAHI